MNIEEGMILLQDTCDSIRCDMNGNWEAINEHTEHWLIKEIKKENVILYNLDNGREWKLDKKSLEILMRDIWDKKIKPILRLSEERG